MGDLARLEEEALPLVHDLPLGNLAFLRRRIGGHYMFPLFGPARLR